MTKFNGRSGPMQDMDESFYQRACHRLYLHTDGAFYVNRFGTPKMYESSGLSRGFESCALDDLSGYFNQQIPVKGAFINKGALGGGKFHVKKGPNGRYIAVQPIQELSVVNATTRMLVRQSKVPSYVKATVADGVHISLARLAWYIHTGEVPAHFMSVNMVSPNGGFVKSNLFIVRKSLVHLFRYHSNEKDPTSQYRFVHRTVNSWGYDVQIDGTRHRRAGYATDIEASNAVEELIWHWKRANGYPTSGAPTAASSKFASGIQVEHNLSKLRRISRLAGFSGPDDNGFYRVRFKGTQITQSRNKNKALTAWWNTIGHVNWPTLQELLEVHGIKEN